MDIEQINIRSLPSVRLRDRRNLPNSPGVYFVIDEREIVYYIGRSKSLSTRWASHGKTKVFEGLTGKAEFFIHFIESVDHEQIEKDAIRVFSPLLNKQLCGESTEIRAIVDFLKESQDVEFGNKKPVSLHKKTQFAQSNIFGGFDLPKGEKEPFTPSKYQQAIFEWIQHGSGDAIVTAVAGSGKTTTLVEAAKLIKTDGVCRFLAFNKSIAEELRKRLPEGAIASTIHSLGTQSCGSFASSFGGLDFRATKYLEIVKSVRECDFRHRSVVIELCNKARTQAIRRDPSEQDLMRVAQRFGIRIPDDAILSIASFCIHQGVKQFIEERIIDHSDQVWLPVALDLPVPGSQFMMVDECQDLNPTQLRLLMKSKGDGRALWVGDASQSIYRFAGAASDSIDRIKDATNAKVLPLSISYRCAKSIVRKAQEFDDSIMWHSLAPDGEVVDGFSSWKLISSLAPGDLVICRRSLPLVSYCMRTIGAGKKAKLVGEDDLKKRLLGIFHKYMKDRGIAEFEKVANRAILHACGEGVPASEIEEIEALVSIYKERKPGSIEGMEKAIKSIFTTGVPKIRFSTIHKAKGLEADRVFVLEWKKVNTHASSTEEDLQQERNLRYVAITRAKSSLYLVD